MNPIIHLTKKLCLAILIALLTLMGTAQAVPAPINLDVLDSYVRTVQGESVFDPSVQTLMQGASKGLRAWLVTHGMRPQASPAASTVAGFKGEFLAAMAANPRADVQQAFYASLKGMLEPLHEPYTRFMTPIEYGHLQARIQGTDEAGLGVRLELDAAGQATVSVVFDGSPAAQQGIRVGDRVERVDGVSLRGLTLPVIRDRLGGPVGSPVRLALQRSAQPVEVTLLRQKCETPAVTRTMLGARVGYVRLHAFSQNVAAEMDAAFAALRRSGAHAFVVDLRDNRGGYVSSAIDVSSRFLPPGTCVMSLSQKRQPTTRYATYSMGMPRSPLVLLVNERTASASEIVAGALQDHHAATLVGVRTFGKGLVQKVIPLNDGSAFAISTGKYLTPTGRDLHKHGVMPDVVMKTDVFVPLQSDPQVKRATALLEQRLARSADSPPQR